MAQKTVPLEPEKFYHVYNHANGKENLFANRGNYLYFLKKYAEHLYPYIETYAYCLLPNHFHLLIRVRSEERINQLLEGLQPSKSLGLQPSKSLGLQPSKSLGLQPSKSLGLQPSKSLGLQPSKSLGLQPSKSLGLQPSKSLGLQPSKSLGLQPSKSLGLQPSKSLGLQPSKSLGLQPSKSLEIEKVISKKFSNLFNAYTQAFNKQQGRMGSLFMPNFKRKEIDTDEYLIKVLHYIHFNPLKHGLVKNIEDWVFTSYHSFLSEKKTLLEKQKVIELFGSIKDFKDYHLQNLLVDELEMP